jgi:hypothetical protein
VPLTPSNYNPPLWFKNAHVSTIYSAKFRKTPKLLQKREKIVLSDGDFLHVDWSFTSPSKNRIIILLHGLEGNAQRPYIKAMAYHCINNNWDVAALNFRGCSGVTNLKYESYHAGKTNDLQEVINHVLEKNRYTEIALIGFSLGGNLALKYLGTQTTIPKEIKKAVAISTPVHLKSSLIALEKPENFIYRTVFLKSLRKKVTEKMHRFPEKITKSDLAKITSLKTFDDIYTAPAHGFKDAEDYYNKNSSLQFLPLIKTKVLLLNSLNDTFLSPKCFPKEFAYKKNNFYLETPKYGGHVGFHQTNHCYYNERRALEFLNQ